MFGYCSSTVSIQLPKVSTSSRLGMRMDHTQSLQIVSNRCICRVSDKMTTTMMKERSRSGNRLFFFRISASPEIAHFSGSRSYVSRTSATRHRKRTCRNAFGVIRTYIPVDFGAVGIITLSERNAQDTILSPHHHPVMTLRQEQVVTLFSQHNSPSESISFAVNSERQGHQRILIQRNLKQLQLSFGQTRNHLLLTSFGTLILLSQTPSSTCAHFHLLIQTSDFIQDGRPRY